MPDKVVDSDQVEQQVAQHQKQHLKAHKASTATPERIKSIKSTKSIKSNSWKNQKHKKHQKHQRQHLNASKTSKAPTASKLPKGSKHQKYQKHQMQYLKHQITKISTWNIENSGPKASNHRSSKRCNRYIKAWWTELHLQARESRWAGSSRWRRENKRSPPQQVATRVPANIFNFRDFVKT